MSSQARQSTQASQLKPVAIIGAMAQEVTILTEQLTNPQQREVAGIRIHTGELNGVAVVVLQSGIGKVNATIATTLVIEQFRPRAVVNTGSAGGIGEGLAIGDVVLGDSVTHHDVDLTAFGYEQGQMAQMPVNYPSDAHLLEVIEQASTASDAFTNAKVHKGLVVSGDQFIASRDKFMQIKNTFNQALAVEMEAAAIAQTCYRFGTPFVVVRAISDLAMEASNVSFDAFVEQAGKQSAQMVIHALPHL